jgi:hypothetical protein
MKLDKENSEPKYATTGRWVFILLLSGVLYFIMDARFLISGYFPFKTYGFAALAIIYLAISLLLVAWKPAEDSFFNRIDKWAKALLSTLCRIKRPARITISCAIVLIMTTAGCFLRWAHIARTPIKPNIADMLPLINNACNTLASGANPYDKIYLMPWKLPLTFWPGLWMPYLIPYGLGIDLRWIHIGCVVGIASIFGLFIIRSFATSPLKQQSILLPSLAGLSLFLFSNELISFAGIAHTPPQWFWVSLLAASILMKRPFLSAIFLGIVLASRQTAVVYAPIMAIYWLRTTCSLRTAATFSIITICTYLLICGPFLILDPYDFIVAPVRHYSWLGKWDFTRGYGSFSAKTIGLTFMLRKTHLEWLLQASTILAITGPLILAWRRLQSETDVLLYLGLAGMAVALTAPIPWHYEYFPSLLLISFAAIAAAEEEDNILLSSSVRMGRLSPFSQVKL